MGLDATETVFPNCFSVMNGSEQPRLNILSAGARLRGRGHVVIIAPPSNA
jgi:hypothetical protein